MSFRLAISITIVVLAVFYSALVLSVPYLVRSRLKKLGSKPCDANAVIVRVSNEVGIVRLEYAFRANFMRYIGRTTAKNSLSVQDTLPIVYNCTDPHISVTLEWYEEQRACTPRRAASLTRSTSNGSR